MRRRKLQGLFVNVLDAYQDSDKFKKLKAQTQRDYRRFLLLAGRLDGLGSVPVEEIRPALVQAFLDGLADRPAAQQKAKVVMQAVQKWAIVRDLLPRSITEGTEAPGSDGGHKPWTDEQVAFAENSVSRHLSCAITLAANTGQRGSDLVRMRWTDLETIEGRPGINVTQQKTGLKIWVPFTQALIATMATWERRPGFILLEPTRKRRGQPRGLKPYDNRQQLSDAWDREREKPGMEPLQGLTLHGLRATAVVRLRQAGCSIPEICSVVGMSAKMVERYSRYSIQKENALAAVLRMDGAMSAKKRNENNKP